MKKFLNPSFEKIVSELSQLEVGKRQYYRPIYSLHKWWARRPGALFRSIILLATEPEKELFDKNNIYSKLSNYFTDHEINEKIILDPFMGGGTTLVEANRLGLKVIGCDLNPVSYWIVKESLKDLDTKKLNSYFIELNKNVGKKIRELYVTQCNNCKQEVDTLYAFWIRYITCPHCNSNIYLYKRCLLNEGLSRTKPISKQNPATVFCPYCFTLNDWDGTKDCKCKNCNATFNPLDGTYDQGKCTCKSCGNENISLVEAMRSGQKLKEKLIAIEYICNKCGGRYYKNPDENDNKKLENIEKLLSINQENLIIPKQEIIDGDTSERWRNHNYLYYKDVFNPRQLLAFNYLIQAIKTIPEKEYQDAFFTVFSNSLEYNNMMTPYNYPNRKIHHLFNYHALPLTTTPVENSVWGIGNEGAGTFINCFNRYLKSKEYCHRPFEKYKDKSGIIKTLYSNEKISTNIVRSFKELEYTNRSALLLCGNSASLPQIPTKSVDYVITDPPYYDSIHYSELSNFFYVWLKSIVDEEYFKNETVPVLDEAIVNDGMNKGEKEYQNLITNVFTEAVRVLKDEGKLIFTFHHTKWIAWWTILMAIVDSKLIVQDSFPVMSEYKVNPHIRNKQALDMDLVIITQKRTGESKKELPTAKEIMDQLSLSLVTENYNNGNNENRLFLHYMGEILKTGSILWEIINYKWFEEVIQEFDEYKSIVKENLAISKTITKNENDIKQLSIFDT